VPLHLAAEPAEGDPSPRSLPRQLCSRSFTTLTVSHFA
jgi:hypothetical protein